MVLALHIDRVSNEIIVYHVIDDLAPERERFFAWDKATWVTEDIEAVFGTGQSHTDSVWNLKETDVIESIRSN